MQIPRISNIGNSTIRSALANPTRSQLSNIDNPSIRVSTDCNPSVLQFLRFSNPSENFLFMDVSCNPLGCFVFVFSATPWVVLFFRGGVPITYYTILLKTSSALLLNPLRPFPLVS